MEPLGDRVLSYDTDSVLYTVKPGQFEPPTGVFLGELTNELPPSRYIATFVPGGPKNYAYQMNDGKTCCKVRGITLNYRNSLDINFQTMKIMVRGIGPDVITVTDPHKIYRDKETKSIVFAFNRRTIGLCIQNGSL